MIINVTSRSSSVRHISRMHRVELRWSLARVKWGSNISFVTSTRKKTNGGHSCQGFISCSEWNDGTG